MRKIKLRSFKKGLIKQTPELMLPIPAFYKQIKG